MHRGAGEPSPPVLGTPTSGVPSLTPRLLQIVAQKRVTKPLFLKYGKFAGKSTITVSGQTCAGSSTGLGHAGGTELGHWGGTGLGCMGGTKLGYMGGTKQGPWDGTKLGHVGGTQLRWCSGTE